MAAAPNNTITTQNILKRVAGVEYASSGKMTIAFVTMANGFKLTGESSCVDPANFDKKLGEEYALEAALKKAIDFEAYLLQERLYLESPMKKTALSPLSPAVPIV